MRDPLPPFGEIFRRHQVWADRNEHASAAIRMTDERARRAVEGGPIGNGWMEVDPPLPTMLAWCDPASGLDLSDGPIVISFDDDGEHE